MTLDPIHQFEIKNLFKIGQIGDHAIYFTNSSAYMLLTVAVICLLTVRGMKGRQLVPGRYQSMAELSYVFVANMIRSTAGEDGMKFFALVYSLFMFILVSNLIGIIPYTFTVASHIIVTAAFALLVFFTVLAYGFYKNGLKFFKIFVPPGDRQRNPAFSRPAKGKPGRAPEGGTCEDELCHMCHGSLRFRDQPRHKLLSMRTRAQPRQKS
jgi:F-type H+-transporting ATPase subunit a